jgi:RNA polymerase-binding transcription factor DksA
MGHEKSIKVKKLTKKEIGEFKFQLVEIQDVAFSRVTESKNEFEGVISLSINQGGAQLLNQVKRALEKIEEGTYGICDISLEPIPRARLQAMPYAIMTVQAQELLEKRK